MGAVKKEEKIFYPDWKTLTSFFLILLVLTAIFFCLWIVFKFILLLIPAIFLSTVVAVWVHSFMTELPQITVKSKSIRLLHYKKNFDLAPQNLYCLEYSPAGVRIYQFKHNSKHFSICPEKYKECDLLYAEFDRLFKAREKDIKIIDMRKKQSDKKTIL